MYVLEKHVHCRCLITKHGQWCLPDNVQSYVHAPPEDIEYSRAQGYVPIPDMFASYKLTRQLIVL